MPANPTPRRKRFGQLLRDVRERSFTTTDDVASLLRVDQATISRYERGHMRPSWPAVLAILHRCKAADTEHAIALDLWEGAGQRAVRLTMPPGSSKEFRAFLRAEAEADTLRMLSPLVIHGLLQTPEYTRAIHDSGHRFLDRDVTIEKYVAARLNRQKRLDGADPLHVHALLDEAVIQRVIGCQKVMAEQLRHLTALQDRDNVTIQVIPFGTGAYGNMSGGCTIVGHYDEQYSSSVYVEHTAGGVWVEDGDDVERFELVFGDAADAALKPEESSDFIRSRIEALEE